MEVIDIDTVQRRLQSELPAWQTDGSAISRTFSTRGWPGTLLVVNTIAYLSEAAWHHPDLAVSYKAVTVTLTTHSSGGITERDLELASRIDDVINFRSALPKNGASSQLMDG